MRILTFLSLFLLLCQPALAAPFDIFLSQRNIADTATLTRTVPGPGLGQPGIMAYRAYDNLPVIYRMGNSFMLNGSTLETASDWIHVTNKPIFAPVATSGDYNDLINRPSMPGSPVNADWNAVGGLAEILNKPSLSSVATTGLYSDLAGKPTIPAAQVSSDWAAASGVSQILNKPSSLAGYGITDAYPLSGNPSGFLTGITSGQVTAALGFTPYSASNPSNFVSQSGARSAISLTTTGTAGAATYNSSTGVLNIPNYAPGTGTVTSVTAGSGLSGGTFTTSGTISMPAVGAPGTYSSVTTDAQGRVTAGNAVSINDSPARALVTATNATGFQVSSSRVAHVCYEGSFSTTSTIGGPSSATVFLETSDTNSTTPGDWTVKAQQTYSNTITLAVVLNQVQGNNWSMCRYVPAGKFVRLRTGNVTGTASATINASQQEVLL